jgi:hypothetical protein
MPEHEEGARTPIVELDVPVDELIEALNDEEKGRALMARRNWTSADLVARAEKLSKSLTVMASDVSRV